MLITLLTRRAANSKGWLRRPIAPLPVGGSR